MIIKVLLFSLFFVSLAYSTSWKYSCNTDEFDDSLLHFFYKFPEKVDASNPYIDDPAIVIGITQEFTNIFCSNECFLRIDWGTSLGFGKTAPITYRFGKEKAVTENLKYISGVKASIFQIQGDFKKNLSKEDILKVKAEAVFVSFIYAEFDLSGLKDIILKYSKDFSEISNFTLYMGYKFPEKTEEEKELR